MRKVFNYRANVEDMVDAQVGAYVANGGYKRFLKHMALAVIIIFVYSAITEKTISKSMIYIAVVLFLYLILFIMTKFIVAWEHKRQLKKVLGNLDSIDVQVVFREEKVDYQTNVMDVTMYFESFNRVVDWKKGVLLNFNKINYLYLPEQAFTDEADKEKWKAEFLEFINSKSIS